MKKLKELQSIIDYLNSLAQDLYEQGKIIDFQVIHEIRYDGFLEQIRYEIYDNISE